MSIKSQIDAILAAITVRQAKAIQKSILVTFLLGWKQSGISVPLSSLQKEQIAKIYKENLGAINDFNSALGKQMATTIKERIAKGGAYSDIQKDIRQYVTDTFGEKGVTIDRSGTTRKIVEVGKNGELRWATKKITRPYTSTIDAYSQMLSRTSAHAALEAGRADGYKKSGVKKVRFVGPSITEERTRPWHGILVGNVYEVDSDDYYKALSILSEPNCRHRFIPFFDDDRFDTPQSVFDKRREESGVYWNEDKKQWSLPE